MDITSELLLDKVLLPSYGMPKVTQGNTVQQMDHFDDIFWFVDGFKNGVVMITGEDSKLYKCNKNITDFKKVYWDNW